MRVSVLVPVFNGEKYLAECLESILDQDFKDVEILIVDDGSTDGSLAIIKRFAERDARIRWQQNPHNLGLTENQNRCLREARGEFIKFVHQDDKLLSVSAITKLTAALVEHPDATLAASASDLIDADSRPTKRRDFFKPGVWDGKRIILATFEAVANMIGEPTVVMFRKASAARGFLPEYRQNWDWEMWYHLLEQGTFVYLAEPLCGFRQHAGQQTEVNRRNGRGPTEMLTLLQTYYAKPWLRETASQRMLINLDRFLRKQQLLFGPRGERLRQQLRADIKPTSYPVFWVERRANHLLRKIKKLTQKNGRPPRG